MVDEEIHNHDGRPNNPPRACPNNLAMGAGGSCALLFPGSIFLFCQAAGGGLFACHHLPP
jgi:hypothetical protein